MKLENVAFVPVELVDGIHASALSTGGASGLRDTNLLESAVGAPQATFDGRPLYGSLAEMAATYAWGLARNRPFVDGNKRTAFVTALTFLEMNGKPIDVDERADEWVDLMVRIASDSTLDRRVRRLTASSTQDEKGHRRQKPACGAEAHSRALEVLGIGRVRIIASTSDADEGRGRETGLYVPP